MTTNIRQQRARAIAERFDGQLEIGDDIPRWFGVQTSDMGGVYFYTGESMRDIADSLASDLDDGWTIGGCFDLDTGQNYSVKVSVECEVDAEVDGDVVLPDAPRPGLNAPLGHVIDIMGDVSHESEYVDVPLNEAGRLAAKHAEVILRDAMGEDAGSGDLLRVAAYAIRRAGEPYGLAESLLFPLRAESGSRDHVTLSEIGALIEQAALVR